ncbi:type II and III secretion system protein family protein [Vibrio sagamiensis]|uniref:General secretion pathway protein GspD n=1 Tax=Vibrio sagamiensis NBRC 104589 TaxID=1219064 RepID=A0A511QFC8_9VIBR|nr:pilus assembly protein N-terminal domain-containing protein [Vibrio sagamiensis]GEM76005.1 general secretion pathway protein GspD [Vibrio sagamiensis NBRC 104589]
MILAPVINMMSTLLNRNLFIIFTLFLAFSAQASVYLSMSVNETRYVPLSYIPKDIVIGSEKMLGVTLTDSNNLYFIAHSAGKSKVIVKGENETIEYIIQIRDVDKDVDSLNKYLGSAGFSTVRAVKVAGKIYINGSVKDSVEKRELNTLVKNAISSQYIDNTTITENRQIQIKLTMAEVSKHIDEELGIQWSAGWSKIDGITSDFLKATIGILSRNNLATVLTRPSIIVTNNSTASFEAGGEIPVLTSDDGNVDIDFKKYGIQLEFKPEIKRDQSIDLRANISSSQIAGFINLDGNQTPQLNTRKVNTELNVHDGDIFVLAGLIDNSQSQAVTKVPLLGYLPIIGALFTSENFQSNKTELMVFAEVNFVENSIDQPNLPQIKLKSSLSIFTNIDFKSSRPEIKDFIENAKYHYEN